MSSKASSNFHQSVLRQNNPLKALMYIYNQFLVTPIDKANGKVAFISQRFYALVPIKELDLDHNNTGTNKTNISVHLTNNHVISDHTRFLGKKFSLVIDVENRKLPNIY